MWFEVWLWFLRKIRPPYLCVELAVAKMGPPYLQMCVYKPWEIQICFKHNLHFSCYALSSILVKICIATPNSTGKALVHGQYKKLGKPYFPMQNHNHKPKPSHTFSQQPNPHLPDPLIPPPKQIYLFLKNLFL